MSFPRQNRASIQKWAARLPVGARRGLARNNAYSAGVEDLKKCLGKECEHDHSEHDIAKLFDMVFAPEATKADRINQLNEIDHDVTKLLRAAGLAVKTLTANPPEAENGKMSLDQRKELFQQNTSEYFTLLSAIDVRLRRQIMALEEANILMPEHTARSGQAEKESQQSNLKVPGATESAKEGSKVSQGGLGGLDVGWLNSRKDVNGKEMEKELWARARELLEEEMASREKRTTEDESTDLTLDHDHGS